VVEALEGLEWSYFERDLNTRLLCPACCAHKARGHAPGCYLAAGLVAARRLLDAPPGVGERMRGTAVKIAQEVANKLQGVRVGSDISPLIALAEAATEPVRTKLDVELTVAALRLLEIFLAENRQLILDYLSAPEVNA
jgi:hypothetical protein